MPAGKIKKWLNGYGFIRCDDGEDVFAHVKHFTVDTDPVVGMRVEFEIVDDERTKRPRADQIVVTSAPKQVIDGTR